ncbi:hypothetical protein J7K99_06360 [bacterium]|nr:hypothetical protein [bacterium]
MIIRGSGNVGIGTTSPSAKLDVVGNGEINGQLDMTSHKIVNLAAPTSSNDAATKAYVDLRAPQDDLSNNVLDDLSDVNASSPTSGQVLKWNGSAWVPAADNNTTYSAGQGLTLSGTTFSVNVDGMTIEIGSDSKIRQGNGAVKSSSTNYKLYRNY